MSDNIDHTEVEWQFDTDDLGPVERWLRDLPASLPIAVTTAEPDEHLDTYFDTGDWRVFRSGYALRARRGQGRTELTLKALNGHGNGYATRREVTQYLLDTDTDSIDEIRGSVGDRVTAMRGRSQTGPLFTAITRRKRYRLWREGREIGELSLDNTTFIGESFEDQSQLMRVELETTAEQTKRLQPFVDAMVEACELKPATASKFKSGASILGLQPPGPPDVGSLEVGRRSTITELAFAVLRRHFIEFLRREPGTRLGDDPEELHDMRVAARRMRAAFSLFSDYLPDGFDDVRDDLKWVAAALGDVRDLDVQLAATRDWQKLLGEQDAAALEPLMVELNRRRTNARGRLLEALDSDRYSRLVAGYSDLLSAGVPDDESDLAVQVAPTLVLRRHRKLHRLADRLRSDSDDVDFHQARIQGKRLRYALEFVSPLYGKTVKDFIRNLVSVQDVLGDHQDAIVAIDHLREIATSTDVALPNSTIFSMGRVAERYADEVIESRRIFPKTYKPITGKALERLERELRYRAKHRPRQHIAKETDSSDSNDISAASEGVVPDEDDAAQTEPGGGSWN